MHVTGELLDSMVVREVVLVNIADLRPAEIQRLRDLRKGREHLHFEESILSNKHEPYISFEYLA